MRKRKGTEQRSFLDTMCKCLTISAALFAIIASVMVAYVEFTAQPYEEFVPVIHMYDDSYKTPGFLEFVEQTKNGTWKDLEPIVQEEKVEVVTDGEDVDEVIEENESQIIEEKKSDITENIQKESSKTLTTVTNDVELLAQIIFAEESVFLWKYQSNPEIAERVFKLAGSVIINRARSHYMGASSIHEVLYTKGQYDSRTKAKVEAGQEIPQVVYTWSQELLAGGTIGPQNLVFQSESPQGVVYEVIGNQYFGLK